MRIGLLGGAGQVGSEILSTAGSVGHQVSAPSSKDLDICNRDAVIGWARQDCSDVLINCAAYTAVDAAESDRDRAFAINELGAGNVAAAAAEIGGRVVYPSTDYVFNGVGSAAFTETDSVAPLSVYGASKLAGERVTLENDDAIVLRVSWVFGSHGHNFVRSIVSAARNSRPLKVVDDQLGAPCSAASVADAVLALLDKRCPRGIYHFASQPLTSWYEFACEIVKQGVAKGLLDAAVEVNRSKTVDLNQAATRPAFSQMNPAKFVAATSLEIRDWRLELSTVLDELVDANF